MDDKQFENFLAEEINKTRGIYYPTKAGFLRQRFVKALPCDQLHPNPDDEFCFPDIGPNFGIISRYVKDYSQAGGSLCQLSFLDSPVSQPICVEKTNPDGYMILNGHHRWAAALRIGMKNMASFRHYSLTYFRPSGGILSLLTKRSYASDAIAVKTLSQPRRLTLPQSIYVH